MATKIGYPGPSGGLLTDIDSVAIPGATNIYRNTPGQRQFDDAGNEYAYLLGVASTAIGSVVTYGLNGTTAYLTALSVTGAKGSVAIAMSASVAAQWGWYQIYGFGSALYNGAAVAGAVIFSASTGKVDDAVVTGDLILNARCAATVTGSGAGAVWLAYPFMNGLG